jgi:hypothetical protein
MLIAVRANTMSSRQVCGLALKLSTSLNSSSCGPHTMESRNSDSRIFGGRGQSTRRVEFPDPPRLPFAGDTELSQKLTISNFSCDNLRGHNDDPQS